MPTDPKAGKSDADEVVPLGEGRPTAGDDVHVQLAHHGFFVSGDVRDPEGDDELARTMMSVIKSMLVTTQVAEQPAAKTDDGGTDGSSHSEPSTPS